MSEPAAEIESRRILTARAEVGGGRVVRAGRWPGRGEDPGEIVLRLSRPDAPPGGRTEDSIRVPADALPAVLDALRALQPGEDARDE